jgi:AraC-like DNA-binding protein
MGVYLKKMCDSMSSKSTEFLELTGAHSRQFSTTRWSRRFLKSWGLLYSVNGGNSILLEKQTLDIPANTLLLYKPNVPLQFICKREWEYYWFHFPVREHVLYALQFPEPIPGLGCFSFQEQDNRRILDALQEASELVLYHTADWENLALILVESVLLRASRQQNFFQISLREKLEKAIFLLTREEARKIGQVAAACGMSEPSFYVFFRKAMGTSPRSYREQFFLRKAMALLLNSNLTLEEIADKCQMCDRYYLSNRFKKRFGITPGSLRRREGTLS